MRMRCNCESEKCQTHLPAECQEESSVAVRYIGQACLDCAVVLRQFVVPLADVLNVPAENAQ